MGKMKDSSILKWTQNNKNNKQSVKKEKKPKEEKNKNWLHKPESLTSGHIVYLVKFLGSTEVDQPKGIEVVKDGIKKLKFSQQIKKAGGEKTPKVELTVSVDGVAIQEPKTKKIQHQYPLNRISYCADDKAEKKFFSFITKEEDSEKHTCFVFVSDKLAEEITLTIGQAFDLAYKRFLSGKEESETEKVARLERENAELRKRLTDVGNLLDKTQLADFMEKNDISDLGIVEDDIEDVDKDASDASMENLSTPNNEDVPDDKLINLVDTPTAKLDIMSLNDLNDEDFDPRADDQTDDTSDTSDFFNPRISTTTSSIFNTPNTPSRSALPPILSPPTITPRDPTKVIGKPVNPFTSPTSANDPFGMMNFSSAPHQKPFHDDFTSPNFSLDDLDPLKN